MNKKNEDLIQYKVCTKIINSEISKEYNQKIIEQSKESKESDHLIIEYDNDKAECDLNQLGKWKKLFDITSFPPNLIIKIIKLNNIYYLYTNEDSDLMITSKISNILSFKHRCFGIRMNNKKIKINLIGFLTTKIVNFNNFNIKYKFKIGDCVVKEIKDVSIYPKPVSKIKKIFNKNNYFSFSIDLDEIINNEKDFTLFNAINFSVEIDGIEFLYPIKLETKEKEEKYNLLPIVTRRKENFCIYIRRTFKQNLIISKRRIEKIEKTKKFKFSESKFMTMFFKFVGTLYKKISRKKINLYFEKFASKAEEGVFELFEHARDNSKISKNYFIIEDNIENKKYLTKKNVCVKHSFKYYFLLFASTNIISTESSGHLNILGTVNKHIKKAIFDKNFVFLQHGIIYMKSLKNSAFSKNHDAYPVLFVVSSKKEARIVHDMLNIPKNRLIITGLAVYDKITPNHINQKSLDKVVIMLTWKDYEEHITDFSKTTYYQNNLNLYKMLCKLLPKENIKIVPHPKVKDKMLSVKSSLPIYSGLISEAIEEAKLLITDYSSICYNSFYRGAGVIFYQPDLELYEQKRGKLIPNDDEYIGYRCFTEKELTKLLKEGIIDSKINLNYYRTEKFINNYKSINEFSDGKNTERIYSELKKKKII